MSWTGYMLVWYKLKTRSLNHCTNIQHDVWTYVVEQQQQQQQQHQLSKSTILVRGTTTVVKLEGTREWGVEKGHGKKCHQ